MTCGFFGSTADKGSEVDCSHKVNPRSLLAVARRADFASSRRIWLGYSSIFVKDGRLCVSSRTRSTIIPCWKWPNLSRPPNKRNGSVSGELVNQDRWAVEGQSALGADEATALIITETQRAGLQPPKYAFATPKKAVTRVDP